MENSRIDKDEENEIQILKELISLIISHDLTDQHIKVLEKIRVNIEHAEPYLDECKGFIQNIKKEFLNRFFSILEILFIYQEISKNFLNLFF